jgi:hypothetical protein
VRHNDSANRFDLIGFGLAAAGLEIENLRHSDAAVDVVIAPDPFDEAQMEQQCAAVVKADIRV